MHSYPAYYFNVFLFCVVVFPFLMFLTFIQNEYCEWQDGKKKARKMKDLESLLLNLILLLFNLFINVRINSILIK